MEQKFLMDTSAVIKYINRTLPSVAYNFVKEVVQANCTISFISEIELQVWKPTNPLDAVAYSEFVSQAIIIGINATIIAETICVRKDYRLKLADAIIAATAITFNCTLIGDNDRDFSKVPLLN